MMSETALRKAAAHVVCAPLTVWLMLVHIAYRVRLVLLRLLPPPLKVREDYMCEVVVIAPPRLPDQAACPRLPSVGSGSP
jgi:hypothetical protein